MLNFNLKENISRILFAHFHIRNLHILFLFFCFQLSAQDTSRVTMLFAGDIMGHGPQINAAWDSANKTWDYTPVFQFVKPTIEKADIAIGNLEVTLAGPPYLGYPQFSSPDMLAIACKDAGFDVLATANNHCVDRGRLGLERTIKILDSLNIKYTGTFYNKAHRDTTYPLVLKKNEMSISLLNYTYGTNGIPVPEGNIVNLIDKIQISQDIQKADSQNTDITIPYIHWGIEYERQANATQKDLAKFLIHEGCGAVIGSHPHVVQPIELIRKESSDTLNILPVVYSLGNFVSNQRDRYKDGGIMVQFTINKTATKTFITNFKYIPYWVYKGVLNGKYQYYIIPTEQYLEAPDKFNIPQESRDKLLEFVNDIRSMFQ